MVFVKDLACDNRQAWVQAALNFPEKKHARKLVTLYLGCTGCTANVERTFEEGCYPMPAFPQCGIRAL